MEGRHCFEHLTVEENLLTGCLYPQGWVKAAIQQDLELVYTYFPASEGTPSVAGRLHFGW